LATLVVEPAVPMQCPSCRSFNEIEAAFCNQCGARLEAPLAPAARKARIVVRVLSMVLVLLAIGGVLWIARQPDPAAPRVQPSGMSPAGPRRTSAGAEGGRAGEALSVQAAAGQDEEPRPLDLERAVESTRNALVTLELRGEEGRPLR